MPSVTQKIAKVKQPRGGYINPNQFSTIQLNDDVELFEEENISSNLIGIVVDYMTRFMVGTKKEIAFLSSLKGSYIYDEYENFLKGYISRIEFISNRNEIFSINQYEDLVSFSEKETNGLKLLKKIKSLDDISIINACKLVGYDVCYRGKIDSYKSVEEINPNKNTIFNIRTMINRGIEFFNQYSPIIKDGFTFEGGYTDEITSGDGDFLTKDTLWDFKVSKDKPKKEHTLQLLIYYLMGKHSIHKEFENIKKLGIFNPRLNIVYQMEISNISEDIINEVSNEIIGYK